MPHDAIATCPICGGELAVTRLHCRSCATTLEGDFNVGRFARLSREQFALLESFLRSKGNLKEMERELGLSYPTVRARVEALLRTLGLGDDAAVEDLPPESSPRDPASAAGNRMPVSVVPQSPSDQRESSRYRTPTVANGFPIP